MTLSCVFFFSLSVDDVIPDLPVNVLERRGHQPLCIAGAMPDGETPRLE